MRGHGSPCPESCLQATAQVFGDFHVGAIRSGRPAPGVKHNLAFRPRIGSPAGSPDTDHRCHRFRYRRIDDLLPFCVSADPPVRAGCRFPSSPLTRTSPSSLGGRNSLPIKGNSSRLPPSRAAATKTVTSRWRKNRSQQSQIGVVQAQKKGVGSRSINVFRSRPFRFLQRKG